MMQHGYSHTQTGYVTLVAHGAGVMLLGGAMLSGLLHWTLIVTFLMLVVSGVLFASLTVEVREGYVQWYFGPGFWRKRIALQDINATELVVNPWYYGWGIRYTPHGWLYNVSGLLALQIQLNNGTTLRIGSDRPHELQQAIQPFL